LNSKPRSFYDFSFEIHSKSEEVSMEKVVPFFKSFTTIFYFNIFALGKVLFGSVQIRTGLKFEFKFVWIVWPDLTWFKPPDCAGAHASKAPAAWRRAMEAPPPPL
jgi:hypothetical protein